MTVSFFINRIAPRTEDFLLKVDGRYCFVNASETIVTKGTYLLVLTAATKLVIYAKCLTAILTFLMAMTNIQSIQMQPRSMGKLFQ